MTHPEFPLSDDLIYLNHAAVAPWPLRTCEAVKSFAEQNTRFGAYHYPDWLKKERELREQLRILLNAPSTEDIALVKNTSEALSFVAFGLEWAAGDNIVSSNEEFPSNRIPWQALALRGVEFREADLCGTNAPEEALFSLVDENTRLLTISSIQFASGLRLDLEKVGRFCKANAILFCIDAIQSLGAVQLDVQSCHADFVMADGHKWMCGPEGLGVFYSRPEARDRLGLTQYGWHMLKCAHNYENKPWEIHPGAQRFECGSPNMLGIHALSASLSLLLETGMEQVERAVIANADCLAEAIIQNERLELISTRFGHLKSGIVVFRHRELSNAVLFERLQSLRIVCALRGHGVRLSPHFYHSETEMAGVANLLNRL
ncbi:MAG: aminotransferase class V-fold PLP-dependent enzyme [Methylomicrobium sp.]